MARKAVFMRRGLDSGSKGGKAHGVFNEELQFDYFPVIFGKGYTDEDFFHCRTYSEISCRLGGFLSDYLPLRLKCAVPYVNPNFNNLTFEESTRKYQSLAHLSKGDLIVFYASLKFFINEKVFNPNKSKADGLFILGFFILEEDPIITYSDSLPSSSELSYLKRRFKDHPFFSMFNPEDWDKFLREKKGIFLSGDSKSSGLFDYAMELSSSDLLINNYQPANIFFRERWGLEQSLMRTNALLAEKPEEIKKDLINWLKESKKTSRKFCEEGWKPKYNFKVR